MLTTYPMFSKMASASINAASLCVFKINGTTLTAEATFSLAIFANETSCLFYFANDHEFCNDVFCQLDRFRLLPTVDRRALTFVGDRCCAVAIFAVIGTVCKSLVSHWFFWVHECLNGFRDSLILFGNTKVFCESSNTVQHSMLQSDFADKSYKPDSLMIELCREMQEIIKLFNSK